MEILVERLLLEALATIVGMALVHLVAWVRHQLATPTSHTVPQPVAG